MKIAKLLPIVMTLIGCGQAYTPLVYVTPLNPPCPTWREAVDPNCECSAFVQNQPSDNSYWTAKYWDFPSRPLGVKQKPNLTFAEIARSIELQHGKQYVWWYKDLVKAKEEGGK